MDHKGLLDELKALAKAIEEDSTFAETLEKASDEEFETLAKAKIYNMQGKMTADTGEPGIDAQARKDWSARAGLKIAEPKKEESAPEAPKAAPAPAKKPAAKAPKKTPADKAIEAKEKNLAAGKAAAGNKPKAPKKVS
jgi:hypothetical protein